MPEPLDYENPNAPRQPARPGPAPIEARPEPAPPVAVPAEFDVCLTRSADHAGVAAIEAALRARRIATFRADDGGRAKRVVSLHVRAADAEAAAPVAAQIFARRQKLRSYPKIEMPNDDDRPGPTLPWIIG